MLFDSSDRILVSSQLWSDLLLSFFITCSSHFRLLDPLLGSIDPLLFASVILMKPVWSSKIWKTGYVLFPGCSHLDVIIVQRSICDWFACFCYLERKEKGFNWFACFLFADLENSNWYAFVINTMVREIMVALWNLQYHTKMMLFVIWGTLRVLQIILFLYKNHGHLQIGSSQMLTRQGTWLID